MELQQLDATQFDWLTWRAGSVKDFNMPCRHNFIIAAKNQLREYAVGYCAGESLMCRPKRDHTAVMFFKEDRHFWFHLRNNEFNEIFKEEFNERQRN